MIRRFVMQDFFDGSEISDGISEESRENFLLFLEEVRQETVNCSVVNHTNHSNHSNW